MTAVSPLAASVTLAAFALTPTAVAGVVLGGHRRRRGGDDLLLDVRGGGDEARVAGREIIEFGRLRDAGIGDAGGGHQRRRLVDQVLRQVGKRQRIGGRAGGHESAPSNSEVAELTAQELAYSP